VRWTPSRSGKTESIDRLQENVKAIEGELRKLTEGDRMVALLLTITGRGEICA
jgi:hypothetical protein